jgi:hypothetical protein
MQNMETIKNRYLQDGLDKRLGGIAANLARIASFSINPQNWEAVQTMLEETKFFIEWTAPDAPLNVQAFLVEVQIQITLWHRNWPRIYANPEECKKIRQWAVSVTERIFTVTSGAYSSPSLESL